MVARELSFGAAGMVCPDNLGPVGDNVCCLIVPFDILAISGFSLVPKFARCFGTPVSHSQRSYNDVFDAHTLGICSS